MFSYHGAGRRFPDSSPQQEWRQRGAAVEAIHRGLAMTDVKGGFNQLFLREEELRQAMEMFFYAYRDFTSEADAILAKSNFGRAHHRVIYFVGRYPQITVSDLLGILKITKQSLSRVLGQLIDQGFVSQKQGLRDRRQRLLELTAKGQELERQLSENQRAVIARAYRAAGAVSVEGFRKVLLGIINEEDRKRFRQVNAPAPAPVAPPRLRGNG